RCYIAVQLQSDRLRDEARAENEDFLNQLDENIQKIIKEQVKVQVFKILPKIKKTVNEQLEAEVLTRASNSSKISYDVAADLSELELKKILIEKTERNKLRDEARAENEDFLNQLDENIQKIIKEQVKVQVFKILPKIKKTVNEQLEAEVLTRASNSSNISYAVAADLSELELKKILIEKTERNKSIWTHIEIRLRRKDIVMMRIKMKNPALDQTGVQEKTSKKRARVNHALKEKTSKTSGKSTEGSKSHQKTASESALAEEPMHTTLDEPLHQEFETCAADDQPVAEASQHPECIQPWISDLAKQADSRTSFNELMDTLIDFSTFLMNRLKVDTLTPELLAGPTYELVKGSCKSLVELEFFLEEVYKATTDQLDWNNPEGQQYPHNLLKPLPWIPNSRGRRVIPFDHFINNDLEYLRGGASSRKYTTFVTKTKAADYGHIKESARDVYSKSRIIAATELQIVEWYNYKHLDWITMRKLTNLTVEERFAFNVSLRMFTRSIVIQRRMEDLQLGVESYQKKLNLTKPNTYKSDLKRNEAYTAYSNPRGFIYQNKDKQNRLIRIDELHKFSKDTLNDVRTALDDRLKGIRMKYLPQTI
nr:hypothetical protein [Tanacetum cinerariifolium]